MQIASIAVLDRKPTPATHTFVPADTNGIAAWKETAGTPIGDNSLTVQLRKTPGKIKPRVRLSMPVVVNEDIGGVIVPKVVRAAYADINLTFDSSSSEQERKDLLGILSKLFGGQAQIDGLLVNLENAY